jgi:hypothetical protein
MDGPNFIPRRFQQRQRRSFPVCEGGTIHEDRKIDCRSSIMEGEYARASTAQTPKRPVVYDQLDGSVANLLLQPETRPISHERLVTEVKGIYAGLVMVEAKCIDVDEKQLENAHAQENDSNKPKLTGEQWSTLIALHKTLLHEHHDFFLASQHPSASLALRRLAAKYSMPARMWTHGIHSFLEVLRYRLPESLDHMLAFIYKACLMMTLLYETVPAFIDTWIECLGDLGRCRMAIEDDDVEDREVWSGVARRRWYIMASDKSTHVGRLYHHMAILEKPFTIQDSIRYLRALTCIQESENAQISDMTKPNLRSIEIEKPSNFDVTLIKGHTTDSYPSPRMRQTRFCGAIPTSANAWIECLGDLSRYRMAIEDAGFEVQAVWNGVARKWSTKALGKSPRLEKLHHYLVILTDSWPCPLGWQDMHVSNQRTSSSKLRVIAKLNHSDKNGRPTSIRTFKETGLIERRRSGWEVTFSRLGVNLEGYMANLIRSAMLTRRLPQILCLGLLPVVAGTPIPTPSTSDGQLIPNLPDLSACLYILVMGAFNISTKFLAKKMGPTGPARVSTAEVGLSSFLWLKFESDDRTPPAVLYT